MAVSGTMAAQFKKNRCIVCEGELEKSNTGVMCHACKDKLRGAYQSPVPEEKRALRQKAARR